MATEAEKKKRREEEERRRRNDNNNSNDSYSYTPSYSDTSPSSSDISCGSPSGGCD